jgi:hypothetical protein
MSSKVHSMPWTTTTGFAGIVSLCVFAMFTDEVVPLHGTEKRKMQSAISGRLATRKWDAGKEGLPIILGGDTTAAKPSAAPGH